MQARTPASSAVPSSTSAGPFAAPDPGAGYYIFVPAGAPLPPGVPAPPTSSEVAPVPAVPPSPTPGPGPTGVTGTLVALLQHLQQAGGPGSIVAGCVSQRLASR